MLRTLYFVATSLLSGSWFVVRLLKTRTTSNRVGFSVHRIRGPNSPAVWKVYVWVLAVRWSSHGRYSRSGCCGRNDLRIQIVSAGVGLYGQAAAAELCSV